MPRQSALIARYCPEGFEFLTNELLRFGSFPTSVDIHNALEALKVQYPGRELHFDLEHIVYGFSGSDQVVDSVLFGTLSTIPPDPKARGVAIYGRLQNLSIL